MGKDNKHLDHGTPSKGRVLGNRTKHSHLGLRGQFCDLSARPPISVHIHILLPQYPCWD